MNKKLAEQKKQRRRIVFWAVMALVVVLLAVMPMLAAKNEAEEEQKASILSAKAEPANIDTQIIGGGQLASEAAMKLKIPEAVKLTKYLVGNGDTVKKGDPIAVVDRVSVMTAITGVQDTLDYLSDEIQDAENDKADETVEAEAGGIVKAIYAEKGESVQDVMLEHGALAAVSLDGLMAVKIQRDSELDTGDQVILLFPDDTEVEARVELNLQGVLTITVEDDDYAVGTEVTVLTEDGKRLGHGSLYIYNQWNAAAYSGTVSDILVSEGASLRAGQNMIRLKQSGHTAEFQRLIDKRQEYEELMQELFVMYRTESITAPCDGIVTGVDKDGVFLLSDSGEDFVLNLLTDLVGGRRDMFEAYGVRVESTDSDGMELFVNEKRYWVEDLSALPGASANTKKMTRRWDYAGDTTVYTYDENGLLRADDKAKAGDVLIAVGDAENVYWFVRAEEAKQETRTEVSPNLSLLKAKKKTEDTVVEAIELHISNTEGVARQTFSAVLKATQGNAALTGSWYVESSTFPLEIYGDMLYGTPEKAGEHTVTVGFVPENEKEYITATYTLIIAAPYEIVTTELPEGKVREPYRFTVKVSGSESGIWRAENLPGGLVMNEQTGEVSGSPVMSGTFEVVVIYSDEQKGDLKKTYELKITGAQGPGQGGMGGMTGGFGGMGGGGGMSGGMGGMGGMAQQEDDNLYSMEKLTIASVTSQEHMTVDITIDELDITKIYPGQMATVTVDALAGEAFPAKVTKIANSGENEGGNSKFTVELSLDKSGQMLPGMSATAKIVLDTAENVLCIPVAALSEEKGKTVVYTSYNAEEGLLGAPVEVTVGVADADNVQILTGLDTGTTVYYAYYEMLENTAMPAMSPMPFG